MTTRPELAQVPETEGEGGPTAAAATGWPLRQLQQALAQVAPDVIVEVVPQLASTNTELMRRAREGLTSTVLLVAERQTAGRGRLGRVWHSDAASAQGPTTGTAGPALRASLTFSVAMSFAPLDWSGLSLAVGVSVARALHPALRLKWPNDLWLQDRKLGGILVETAAMGAGRHVVVGVGINIAPAQAGGLSTPPACLQEVWPDASAPAALLRIAPALLQAMRLFEVQGFAPFQAAYAERDALRDRPVQLSDGIHGTAGGVNERGALLVHTSAGMKLVNSAEVSVRPVAPPNPP